MKAYVETTKKTLADQNELVASLKQRERQAAERITQLKEEKRNLEVVIEEAERRVDELENKASELETSNNAENERVREMEEATERKEREMMDLGRNGELIDEKTKESVRTKVVEILNVMEG